MSTPSSLSIVDSKTKDNTQDNNKKINWTNVTDVTNKETGPIKIPFWSDDPNILFHKDYIFEFYPVETMTYEQKLNAVSRSVIILSIIAFVLSRNTRIIIISAITLFAVFILYFYQEKEKSKMKTKKQVQGLMDKDEGFANEGFANAGLDYLKQQNAGRMPTDVFVAPTQSNPFGNVLMSDYDYNPDKKPAPPSYNQNVNNDILKQAKKFVVDANPDQPDIADKLFKDLGDQYVFEQSLRPFNSTASTTIPNDQGAFAEFCYGSMVSCKEGNAFACARNLSRHTN